MPSNVNPTDAMPHLGVKVSMLTRHCHQQHRKSFVTAEILNHHKRLHSVILSKCRISHDSEWSRVGVGRPEVGRYGVVIGHMWNGQVQV